MDSIDEAFFREAQSQIRALNDGLIAIESAADTEVAVHELFRVAHSLKGACHTQGLDEAGELAHAVEDVLGAIRRRDVEPTPALIDEALGAVDLLEAIVRGAAGGAKPTVDVDAARTALRSVLENQRSEAISAAEGDAAEHVQRDDAWAPSDDDLSADVVAALEDTAEFDDIDALLDEVDDEGADDELDSWGLLDDDGASDAGRVAGETEDPDIPDDPSAFFETAREELAEAEANDTLQEDIDAVEFGEFDDDDTYTIDELIDLDPTDASPETGPSMGEDESDDATALGAPHHPPSHSSDQSATEPTGGPEPTVEPGADGPTDPRLADTTDSAADASVEPTAAEPARGEPTADNTPDGTANTADGRPHDRTDDGELSDSNPSADPVDESAVPADTVADADGDSGFVFDHEPNEDVPVQDEAATGSPDATDETERNAPADGEPGPTGVADDGATAGEAEEVADDEPRPASSAESAASASEVPDSDSLPEMDLGVDLSTDFDGASGDYETQEPDLAVAVDDELAEFEARFDDLLGGGAEANPDHEEGTVFRSAVGTIEKSRLDADLFATTDVREDPGNPGEFDRLQATTVDVETADRLLNVAEELSLTHLRLDEAVGPETDDGIREEVANLRSVVAEYRRTVMAVRLIPLQSAIENLPRIVRDIARAQDKDVELVVDDADVELDRSIVDRLRDPLAHIARNAVDHGVEPPDVRDAAGKQSQGTIEIRTDQVGDEVVIEVSDDGQGIDPEAVRSRAIAQGVVTTSEAKRLTDAETYDLVFEPGFTTTDEVTDVSGRGVGMDVVRRTISDLHGSVDIESEPGHGTTLRLTVPVSIALTEVLFVEVTGETFGIPLAVVEQITAPTPAETVDGRDVVRRSDLPLVGELPEGVEAEDAYPLVRLRDALDLPRPDTYSEEEGRLIWIRADTDRIAIRCDRIVTTREVVVRPYGDLLRDVPGVSGATTLGDGEAVTVLDVGSI